MRQPFSGARIAAVVFAGGQRITVHFDPHVARWRPGEKPPEAVAPNAAAALIRHAEAAEAHERHEARKVRAA